MAPQPAAAFNRVHLLVVAVVEGAALAVAALRVALSNGGSSLSSPPVLAWFLVTEGVAASSVMLFSVRSTLLRQREQRGEDTGDARKGVLATSVAIALGAVVIAAVGPAPFLQWLGG